MLNLRLYYASTSLIGIVAVIIGLSYYSRHLALQTLVQHQTRANVDLTNSFANSIWSEFSNFVEDSYDLQDSESLRSRTELDYLQLITAQQMDHTNVVKVKIYNLDGLTVFSTDARQIGKNKHDNLGFQQAASGEVASEISFRNEFYAFENIIVDRNLISTYIPVKSKENNAIVAVFEVYSDVTPLIDDIDGTQLKIIAGVLLSLSALYCFLFLIVNRAHQVIQKQNEHRRVYEEKIRFQAYNDSLTGLPNRNQFTETMVQVLADARRARSTGAIMFLDLNRFKMVNDSLGHDAGDQLLRTTANRIQTCLHGDDVVYRLSGDEFIVVMQKLSHVDDAALLAKRIVKAMQAPVSLNNYAMTVNISIGITLFPREGLSVDELVKQADSAMYRAKRLGNDQYEFYSPEMSRLAGERLTMETELKTAINQEQFILYYQPKIDAATLEIAGVEALIRWEHPMRGIVPPDSFIPLLEETGLINTVGEWVLNTACHQAKIWNDLFDKPLRISVNISARQFSSRDLVSVVRNALVESELPPSCLELELTESMFVEDTEHAIHLMLELKDLGVSLSIDDFGSGYSSLGSLKNFPVDYLKIDRTFVNNIEDSQEDLSIITAITALARSLGLGLVAEGVEDEQQMQLLRVQGCDQFQGYFFSRPIPADEFLAKYIETPIEFRKAA